MRLREFWNNLKTPELRMAWIIALAADVAQIAVFPTFAEGLPGFDLFPTWTAAVFFVTRNQVKPGEPEILPPGPAPAPRP